MRCGAAMLTPGTACWRDAFRGFGEALSKSRGPKHAASNFWAARERVVAAQKHGACFVNCFMKRSRSGYFEVLTWEVEKHPLTGHGNEGIIVNVYVCHLQRNGRITVGAGTALAFISWHALARMRERSNEIDIFEAGGVVAGCGLAGVLMRESVKHVGTEINYTTPSMICTGVLRLAEHKGKVFGFYDVLTTLPIDDLRTQKRSQGVQIAHAVWKYIKADDADPRGYGDDIAVLPCRNTDYVSRYLAAQS
jgi:hypothetical protein